jgi:hypothetical protein
MQLRKIIALILLLFVAGGLSGFAQKKPTTYTTPTRNTPVGGNTRNTPVGGNKAGMPSRPGLPQASISPYGRQQQASRQPTPRQLRRLTKAAAGQGKTQQGTSGSPRALKPAIPAAKSQPVILTRSQAKPRLDRLRAKLLSNTAPIVNRQWNLGSNKSEQKWKNQMASRGWTREQIDEAVDHGRRFSAPNNVNPAHGATRYVNPATGRSIVLDNVTREVIHVGGDGFKY